ncbi:proteasome core particle subunit beta 3 [Coemansia sp. RSA 2523]|nr:proteasome core particle subunit beta 3 [Coemansia sp. RSA 1824]KAJ1792837.1 proteasome core particle subunit beta 3 [Coemansia sp. RSA 2167]KAJ1810467.1 proteasome core particle subunit beta 3 [Coemansia sp. RSA 2523]KAJ2131660.1 proteasome core particle subunit beta 3 [Coemansia sp. RSA 921]KAJ2138563.1 proteasome core particle subunit beta 3 [Coemansia sp. RSA 788]KAJ2255646.1 proteasome core particle subunit beta 3 [Coemansia sp. RSA 454]KAJ2276427.1 proteasome core particle subunit be
MSIMEYNGSAVVAMVGKNCVAIATDKRLGQRALTVDMGFEKVAPVTDNIYIGLAGLATDVMTLHDRFRMRVNLYKHREERTIEPKTFSNMVSHMLYERRFGPYFVEPVIAGLEKNGQPFICSMDLIGCINYADDFVVAGTAADNLFGMCESLWEPDLGPEELFETVSQAMLNAVDRDSMSGWGAVVHILTPEGVITRELKGRMD